MILGYWKPVRLKLKNLEELDVSTPYSYLEVFLSTDMPPIESTNLLFHLGSIFVPYQGSSFKFSFSQTPFFISEISLNFYLNFYLLLVLEALRLWEFQMISPAAPALYAVFFLSFHRHTIDA